MINKMSQWLSMLTHYLDCQLVNDKSQSRSQEGPTRDLTPLRTPQQTEEGKADKTRGKQTTSLIFSISNCIDLMCFLITYRLTKHPWGCSLQSPMQPSLLPDCPLSKVTIRPMDLHKDNLHVSSIKRISDLFIVLNLWPSSWQEKRGRG